MPSFLVREKVKTVIPAEAVAQLVGGLTAQLKDKEVKSIAATINFISCV
jgi:hypothetical protein